MQFHILRHADGRVEIRDLATGRIESASGQPAPPTEALISVSASIASHKVCVAS